MDAKDVINYKKLSIILTGNDNIIRKEKCPKIHKAKVDELEALINYFLTKNRKQ